MIPVSRISFEVDWGLIPLLADARCDFDSIEMFAKEEVFDVGFALLNRLLSNLWKMLVWFNSNGLSHTEPELHPRHRRSPPKIKLVLIHNNAKG